MGQSAPTEPLILQPSTPTRHQLPHADPAAADQLDVALRSDLEHLAVPALAVAVETNSAVGDLIKAALLSTVLSIDALERIADALPYSSFALAETAAIAFQRLADESVNDTGQRAVRLVSLANWRRALGRREDALAAIDEAVPAPVLTSALYERFTSRGEADYADKLLSAMRYQFGGHLEKSEATPKVA